MPEITLIFYRDQLEEKKPYLYAFPLTGKFLLPWSRWAKVISPRGFVLPPMWAGRQILGMENNKALLGPMIDEDVKNLSSQKQDDVSFAAFSRDDSLFRPQELFTSEDYPAEFAIKFTSEAQAHMDQMDKYYRQINSIAYTKPKP